jgi:phage tail-like protein
MGATVLAQLSVRRSGQMLWTTAIKNDVFTIGRLPSCDLVLPDTAVSRNHAEIRVGADGTVLTDLESETGTLLGDDRLLPHRPYPLVDGTIIRIGPFDVMYRSQVVTGDEAAKEDDLPHLDTEGPAALASVVPDEFEDEDEVPDVVEDSFASRHVPADSFDPQAMGNRYLGYLPVSYHENDFLRRFLGIFETIWEPLEHRQNHIAMYFSPRTCPVSWLPWLASWFGLTIPDHWPESRVRSLLAEVTELYRWRGTPYGLTRMLEVCTGLDTKISQVPEQPYVIRVVVRAPKSTRPDLEQTLHGLIQAHKAAHVGYVLEVES